MNIPTKESLTVEFKQSLDDSVIETLVAFSNTKGGSVYIGINDKGQVSGLTLSRETIPKFLNKIKQLTSPSLLPNVEIINSEEKVVIILSVDDYPLKPVSVQGIYFKRVDASNHKMSTDEISNMHLKTINSTWDMFPDTYHTIKEISMAKVRKCIRLLKKNGMTITDNNRAFLEKYDLMRDGKHTYGAFLLFKHNYSLLTTIELGRFQDNITIKDSSRTKSDIISQVDEVIEYVQKHINCAIIITGKPQHTKKWDYPLEAIREIVINMIIHRDYRSASDSIVKIFNDKIEFYNPGRLSDDITIDGLLSNNYKSILRNKKIADVFKDFGWIEKYGSGIRRIIQLFKDANLPTPVFRNISEGFQVTIFSENYEKNTENNIENFTQNKSENENISDKSKINFTDNFTESATENFTQNKVYSLNSSQKAVLDKIIKNPNLTSNEISKLVDMTPDTVRKNITYLKAFGIIKRIGSDRKGYWKVN